MEYVAVYLRVGASRGRARAEDAAGAGGRRRREQSARKGFFVSLRRGLVLATCVALACGCCCSVRRALPNPIPSGLPAVSGGPSQYGFLKLGRNDGLHKVRYTTFLFLLLLHLQVFLAFLFLRNFMRCCFFFLAFLFFSQKFYALLLRQDKLLADCMMRNKHFFKNSI